MFCNVIADRYLFQVSRSFVVGANYIWKCSPIKANQEKLQEMSVMKNLLRQVLSVKMCIG